MNLYKVKVKGTPIEGHPEITEDIVYTDVYAKFPQDAIMSICFKYGLKSEDILEVWYEQTY